MISAKKLIYKIVEKISTLKGDVSSLNTSVSSLNTSVSSLNTSVSSLNTNCVKKGDVVRTNHTTGTISINGNDNYSHDFTFSKAGYRPISHNGHLVNWVSGQTSLLNFYNEEMTGSDGNAVVGVSIRNMHTAQCQFSISFYITWIKL